MTFYEQHYKVKDGKLELYPSQALETWWDCTNSMPEVAGMHFLTGELQRLPANLVSKNFKNFIKDLQAILPEIPTREFEGIQMLAPARRFEKKNNIENPELYAVYPFKLFGLNKPDIDLAIHALEHRWDKGHFGWRQDDLFMALLGLTDDARKGLAERAGRWDDKHRFPAFWGPNYDWTPDQDHGGVFDDFFILFMPQRIHRIGSGRFDGLVAYC
ncbi:MAG: hypothetical protein ABIL68_12550 [bacterium]